MIQVEAAGPNLPEQIRIIPNRLVSMAEWVFANCIRGSDHIGGFITSDLRPLENYVIADGTSLDLPYREFEFTPYFQSGRLLTMYKANSFGLRQLGRPRFSP